MVYAIIVRDGKEQLCCVDKIGKRAFPAEEFFRRDLGELCIDSNKIQGMPQTMEEFIQSYDVQWADDMALFFGSNPELGIALDPEREWAPLVKLEEAWSPLEKTRGRSLLEA